MGQLEFDMTALDNLFPHNEGFFLNTPESKTVEVPSIEAIPLEFTELHNTYTADERRILARMQAKDSQGRDADIRIVETGQNGEPRGYSFDIAFRGLTDPYRCVILTDTFGNQLESTTPANIDSVRVVNGAVLYDVSMKNVGWRQVGRQRDGSNESVALFTPGHKRFQGGGIAVK